MLRTYHTATNSPVAPLAGAWIEIMQSMTEHDSTSSLPSRERGLKWSCSQHVKGQGLVAPLAGAWIEISPALYTSTAANVAPLAGAWIEIAALFFTAVPIPVAPLAGAWIEIVCLLSGPSPFSSLPSRERGLKSRMTYFPASVSCRSPRGSVD